MIGDNNTRTTISRVEFVKKIKSLKVRQIQIANRLKISKQVISVWLNYDANYLAHASEIIESVKEILQERERERESKRFELQKTNPPFKKVDHYNYFGTFG